MDKHTETANLQPWELVHLARSHPGTAAAEILRLRAEIVKLRATFRVNALRWSPNVISHAEIDRILDQCQEQSA